MPFSRGGRAHAGRWRSLRAAGDEGEISPRPSLEETGPAMRICCVLVILMCVVPSACESLASSSDKVQNLQIFCMPAKIHKPVFVPCPNVTAVEVQFKFFEDKMEVSNYTISSGSREIPLCSSLKSELQLLRLCQDDEENTVGFIFNASAFRYDALYTCQATVTYPPPYRTIPSDQRALFRVKEDHYLCKINKSNTEIETGTGESSRFPWIWTLVVVLLSTYGLALSITALVFWAKLRQADLQNDYMNAKPIGPRKRRKKNGFKNPIPKHF